MKTFKEWLQTKTDSNTNIGDLANDASVDDNFPDGYNKEVYETYLAMQGACSDAMGTFGGAWNTYITELDNARSDASITSITLTDIAINELDAIVEAYRFPSRSSAIEFLIRRGL